MSRSHPIPLGFQVDTGTAITIPAAHMAVVGITQQSGKTTTLESLAHRCGWPVIAFVTKRGEGSFGAAPGHDVHSLQPYFRERADWQFVEAVLEATMRERMKYERQWIMRVTRGAKTLQDVRLNTRTALEQARGDYMKGVFEKLLAYLEIVVPQLGRVRWAPTVQPRNGLNVMNLSEMSSEVQALVIASTLDYVMEKLGATIVVIPEAWEFIPRGRKSPVTLAAESFARKGAALKNFLWIDSQDLAGVHTPVLKQVTVWLLGVQREINEVKRTLAMVPAVPKKLKPEDVTTLGLGQFWAVWSGHAIKTYVQPWWMEAREAEEIAVADRKGFVLPSAPHTPVAFTGFQPLPPMPSAGIITDIEDPMDAQLRADNERLTRENAELRERIGKLEGAIRKGAEDPSVDLQRESARPGPSSLVWPMDIEQAYAEVRSRLLTDPTVQAKILQLQTTVPEIIVEVVPRVVKIDGSTSRGRIARLIGSGFFDSAKRQGECRTELQRTGTDVNGGQVSTLFSEFVRDGFLTRHGSDRYIKADGLKVTTKELQAV